jgi:hypothetical protein
MTVTFSLLLPAGLLFAWATALAKPARDWNKRELMERSIAPSAASQVALLDVAGAREASSSGGAMVAAAAAAAAEDGRAKREPGGAIGAAADAAAGGVLMAADVHAPAVASASAARASPLRQRHAA